jgi:hypothetical protein
VVLPKPEVVELAVVGVAGMALPELVEAVKVELQTPEVVVVLDLLLLEQAAPVS